MNKLIQRLLVFIIGVPLTICLVLYFPQKNHIAVNVAVILLSALGAIEFAGMLKKKGSTLPSWEAAILGSLAPLAMTLMVSFGWSGQSIPMALTLGAAWLLVSKVFTGADKFQDINNQVVGGFAVMIYPGLFMAWIIRMSLIPLSDMVILMFLLMVMGNDSLAWAAGMLFGKGNRGIVPASPNKSIAGFIGGFIVSILVGLGAVLFFPLEFSPTRFSAPLSGILLGLICGIAGTLGDLGESALKRSAGTKDSGTIIPGRGGILDTIDSIALAAPVYYGLYWLLFN
ncbi:phosphatidate cytidylyltransferase [Treponema primitia ZAS-2]|uniref:Phosphatidate cytidylyltransferase n=1 Tax=Treponema primitia (strain ATCC BAA-887 / DSM 12427 / ZAS-2) TaxID=545694 RepID=F5YR61_TREPZ|nr:phosphatidate cytidylyltransferase [Treponema primitia]AEF85889.1 phosphatidate cytidylyltransferase [Treponema primitia ZAS-2]